MSENIIVLSSDDDDIVIFSPNQTNDSQQSNKSPTVLKNPMHYEQPKMPRIVSVCSYNLSKPELKRDLDDKEILNPISTKKMRPSTFIKEEGRNKISSAVSISQSIEDCIAKYSVPGEINSSKPPANLPLIDKSLNESTKKKIRAEIVPLTSLGAINNAFCTSNHNSVPICINLEESSESPEEILTTVYDHKYISPVDNVQESEIIYRQFMTTCENLEPNEEYREKLRKKLERWRGRSNPSFVQSKNFTELLKNQLEFLKTNSSKLYLCIKSVLEALKSNQLLSSVEASSNLPHSTKSEEKTSEILQKLERTMDKLARKIRRLEGLETDLNDEEDSTYLRLQRYRERFCKIRKKWCDYSGESVHAERVVNKKIKFNGTRYVKLNQVLEKWLNLTRSFPDFYQVKQLIETHLKEEEDMNLTSEEINELAAEAFRSIGKLLQRMRRIDLTDTLTSLIDNHMIVDPADSDPELAQKLLDNKRLYGHREQEIINHFAEKERNEAISESEVSTDNESEAKCYNSNVGKSAVSVNDQPSSRESNIQNSSLNGNCNRSSIGPTCMSRPVESSSTKNCHEPPLDVSPTDSVNNCRRSVSHSEEDEQPSSCKENNCSPISKMGRKYEKATENNEITLTETLKESESNSMSCPSDKVTVISINLVNVTTFTKPDIFNVLPCPLKSDRGVLKDMVNLSWTRRKLKVLDSNSLNKPILKLTLKSNRGKQQGLPKNANKRQKNDHVPDKTSEENNKENNCNGPGDGHGSSNSSGGNGGNDGDDDRENKEKFENCTEEEAEQEENDEDEKENGGIDDMVKDEISMNHSQEKHQVEETIENGNELNNTEEEITGNADEGNRRIVDEKEEDDEVGGNEEADEEKDEENTLDNINGEEDSSEGHLEINDKELENEECDSDAEDPLGGIEQKNEENAKADEEIESKTKSDHEMPGTEGENKEQIETESQETTSNVETSKSVSKSEEEEEEDEDEIKVMNVKLVTKRTPRASTLLSASLTPVGTPIRKKNILLKGPAEISSDERVQRFLQGAAKQGIAITRKRAPPPLSEDAREALERLKKMKGISATRVSRGDSVSVSSSSSSSPRAGPSAALPQTQPPRAIPISPAQLNRKRAQQTVQANNQRQTMQIVRRYGSVTSTPINNRQTPPLRFGTPVSIPRLRQSNNMTPKIMAVRGASQGNPGLPRLRYIKPPATPSLTAPRGRFPLVRPNIRPSMNFANRARPPPMRPVLRPRQPSPRGPVQTVVLD